jgi:hypothetical protein
VACDVDTRQTETVEEGCGVGGVVGDAHRRRGMCAADPPPLVVSDQLVLVRERRFCNERQEAVGQDGADEQYRFARSDDLVFQYYAVDLYAPHVSSSLSGG